MLQPVNPSQHLDIDADRLGGYRSSYRWICYNLETLGRPVNAGLPGDDREDLVQAIYQETDQWLSGG